MRIGELAALLGVSTRMVRYYHRQGVLPEPFRRANGYREYGMRDAIALARLRRLVELGLSLDEAHDIIADDRARELPGILREIDADLTRQEQEIQAKRSRLAELLRQAEVGALRLDDTASPELVAFLREVDVPSSRSAAWDRDLLVLMDGMASPPDRKRSSTMFAMLAADPEATTRGHDFYRRLDELAEARQDDSRITFLATALAEYTVKHMLTDLAPGPLTWSAEAVEPFLDEIAPAQAEVVRQAVRLIAGRKVPMP
ncbi:MerR family transcriptional regulator [Streptosporangium sp. NPDC001681]|uniref:MerR family transcriptional regulator n=1 Tax=Streptosporangium sp. NPDC001681 TaxID=3154395 RepID=UPI0033244EBD